MPRVNHGMVNNGDSFFENVAKIAVTDSCIIKKVPDAKITRLYAVKRYTLSGVFTQLGQLGFLGVIIRPRAILATRRRLIYGALDISG